MKRILSIIASFSILLMLTSCIKTNIISQNSNTPSQIDSTINTTEDSSTIAEENHSSDNESNVSQKPETSNNSVPKNNTTSANPQVNNSTPEESSVDKTPIKTDYNPNLTWEEAYVDNGDGTFQLMFVDGQVYTYVPHPTEEGTYIRKGSSGMGQTFELVKFVWDCQWCKYCGELTKFCHRYLIDIICYDCGEMAKAHTCHICGKN